MKRVIILGIFSAVLTGCGSGANSIQKCTPNGFAMLVRPTDPLAAPDHNGMPPANQEFFVSAIGSEVGPGCASTNLYKNSPAQWTTSDPKNVVISSADDTTNGQATCLGPTAVGASVSATLTAYGFTQTLSTPITCK